MENPIFILGAHKSGTSLFRSLLDNHPELYVIPFETHLFNNLGYPISYEYFKQHHNNIKFFIDNCTKHLNHINNAKDKYADSINIDRFDINTFIEEISKTQGVSNANELIISYFSSVYKSDKQVEFDSSKRIVEKSVTHHEYALELAHIFPEAKFIHIIRNPYANWVALRKYKSLNNTGGPLLYRIANTFINSYYFLYRNQRLINNYKILKYEDLLMDSEKTMIEISNFLDIQYNENLLQPTNNGTLWKGNSTSDRKFNGLHSSNINEWQKHIKAIDIYYVNKLFKHILNDFNYNILSNKKGFYKKLPYENFNKYLLNRIYKLYIKN
jgi:hypothetical protein